MHLDLQNEFSELDPTANICLSLTGLTVLLLQCNAISETRGELIWYCAHSAQSQWRSQGHSAFNRHALWMKPQKGTGKKNNVSHGCHLLYAQTWNLKEILFYKNYCFTIDIATCTCAIITFQDLQCRARFMFDQAPQFRMHVICGSLKSFILKEWKYMIFMFFRACN